MSDENAEYDDFEFWLLDADMPKQYKLRKDWFEAEYEEH